MKSRSRQATRAACLLFLLGATVLTGCFSLSREGPPTRHYVLGESRPPESGQASRELAGISVGVRRLRLAAYLEPLRLPVRDGQHGVSYAEYHLWGEPLAGGVNRAVAGALAARAPFQGVDVAPWSPGAEHDYLIQLHLERFEGLAPADPEAVGGEIHMLATWEIVRPRDGAVLARGRTDHRQSGWAVGDYPSLVSSLNTGLTVMADELLTALVKLRSTATEQGAAP